MTFLPEKSTVEGKKMEIPCANFQLMKEYERHIPYTSASTLKAILINSRYINIIQERGEKLLSKQHKF